MKKWLSLLLAVCMIACMLPVAMAEEAQGAKVQKLFEPSEIGSIAMSGDTLYLAGETALYAYENGAASQVGDMPQGDYKLFDAPEGVWAIDTVNGLVGVIEDGAFVQKLALDYAPMQTATGVMDIYGMCRVGNTLYVLARDLVTYTGGQETLLRFDLETGAAQRDNLAFALALYSYDDTVAVLRQDLTRITSGETGMALDTLTEDGALGENIIANMDYQLGAMAQAPDGTMYMSGGGQLKKIVDGGGLSSVCGMSVSNCLTAFARIVEDTYVVLCMDGVLTAPLAGVEGGTMLTILGGQMNDAAIAFMQENPDISLNFDSRSVVGSQSVRDDMQAGTGVDIYVVHELLGLRTLIDKGYVAEITSEALISEVQDMYPQVREALMRDGKLYAYPQLLQFNAWGFNATAWNEVYGEDTPLPETFDEFFDMIEEWNDTYADEYPEYQFTQIYYGWQQLLSTVLEQYALMHATGDEALRFNSEEFVSALERLSSMELDTIDLENLTEETMAQLTAVLMKPSMIEVMSVTSLLSSYASQEEADRREMIAPMVFSSGEEPAIRADLMAYVVNPASENLDAAMTYLEYMAANQTGDIRVLLHESENEPVRPDNYDKQVADAQNELTELRSRLEEATEETDKVDIQAEIDRVEQLLADLEASEWLVTAEAIAAYRELAPYMSLGSAVSFLYGGNDNMSATEELSNLLTRFIDGQMSAQQLVMELDKKVEMIYLEGM